MFEVTDENNPLYALCAAYELEADSEITIKRSLNRDGKGKIFFNDQPISAKLLKEIGKYLVEVHGQFDNQGLLNPANHRDVLDAYAGYKELLAEVAGKFAAYKTAKTARIEAENDVARARSDEEALRHWVDELEKIAPEAGEEETLGKKRLEMMNAEKIIESLSYAFGALTQRADVQSALRQAQSAMGRANALVDGKYDEIIGMLDQALIDVNEVVNELEEASRNVSLNQNELENVESRLFALRGLARKHQVTVDELPQVLADFKHRLTTIELGEEGIGRLRRAEEQARLDYVKAANELSARRKAAALRLDGKVMAELPPLKMEKARFVTVVEKLDETGWNEHGFDGVYFTVATNPNSPQGPINKIASGGELARLRFAELALERPNLMFLDEPTNHLDIYMRESLTQALAAYTGTLLLVTHDRYLMQTLGCPIMYLEDGKATFYPNFAALQNREAGKTQEQQKTEDTAKKQAYGKEQRKRRAEVRARLKKVETEIEELGAHIVELENEINDPEVLRDHLLLRDKCDELDDTRFHQQELYDEWEKLAEEQESFDSEGE